MEKGETAMRKAETPSTNGDNGNGPVAIRDAKGRFLQGNPGGPGNPQAGNVGRWRQALAEAVSAEDLAEVTRRLVEAAKAGKPWAVRELLDRCLGKPHVQIGVEAEAKSIREYTEEEILEAQRLARLLLDDRQADRQAEAAEVPASRGPG